MPPSETSSLTLATLPEPGEAPDVASLYSEHQSWLRTWLRKQLHCSHDAADVAHDTFIRLLHDGGLASIREPRAWLVTTAKRLLIDRGRRRQLEQAYLDELAASAELCAETPSTEQIWIAVQTLDALARALERLPDKPRRAFVLRHIDGWSTPDIAAELRVSAVMVRKYLVQALVACHAAMVEAEAAP